MSQSSRGLPLCVCVLLIQVLYDYLTYGGHGHLVQLLKAALLYESMALRCRSTSSRTDVGPGEVQSGSGSSQQRVRANHQARHDDVERRQQQLGDKEKDEQLPVTDQPQEIARWIFQKYVSDQAGCTVCMYVCLSVCMYIYIYICIIYIYNMCNHTYICVQPFF